MTRTLVKMLTPMSGLTHRSFGNVIEMDSDEATRLIKVGYAMVYKGKKNKDTIVELSLKDTQEDTQED